jgi:hypothetical protein
MGVNYYECDGCGTGYRDDSDYCVHCECGNSFCGLSCGKLENYFNPHLPDYRGRDHKIADDDPRHNQWDEGYFGIDETKPITCVICRKEKENNDVLLEALLKHYKITRKQAIKIWKEQ